MERLGKYEIRGVLGRGAMGTVYEGWDPVIARRVAIKTVRLPDTSDSEERELLKRFQQEAQAAGRLQHPNIVGVYDYAETDELAYIVMEFVAGRTLRTMLETDPQPTTAEIGRLMEGLLAGLGYSHSHEVIHRDIKPANVIVTASGLLKIADFGIARIGGSGMTMAGTIMGTPAYMSPEQFKGTEIDSRTDIYSAGVLLFQLLTGKRPFEGSMATIMHAVLNQPVPPPSTFSATIPPALDRVVARAIAREPADRFQTAAAFNTALQAALTAPALPAGLGDLLSDDDATIVRPTSKTAAPPARSSPPPRNKRPLVIAAAAVLLLLAGGGAYMFLGNAPPPPLKLAATTTVPIARPVEPTPPPAQPISEPAPPPPPIPLPPPAPVLQIPVLQITAVAAALRNVACSATIPDERPPGAVTLRGVAGPGVEPALRDAVAAAAPGIPLDWEVDAAAGPYCGLLDTIRPYVGPAGLAVETLNNRTKLVTDDPIVPRLTMPDFPAHLQLDYVSNDGSVTHMRQSVGAASYAPGSTAVFGQRDSPKAETWEVYEPYGTDLLIGIASSTPLFSAPRPAQDQLGGYLRELQTGLDQAARSGARVAIATLLLRTAPKTSR